ncbi:MAG: hypothetical protein OXC91_12390 [Rhodobacteraceae bacterium]|nr:hypothetical protein [Paracoccaceae bacterium]
MDGAPVHSFRTPLDDPDALTHKTVEPCLEKIRPFQMRTWPTPLQVRAFELLGH